MSIHAHRFSLDLDDGALAGWRWPRPGAPGLVFTHATGFCASAYKQMLARLSGCDVLAIDLRGHGRSTLSADPRRLRTWETFAADLRALLDRAPDFGFGAGGVTLAGHSCGAVVSALAARGRADIAGLALIEPVAPPPATSLAAKAPWWPLVAARLPLVRGARARRPAWTAAEGGRDAARRSYARKALFSTWAEGVLEDYLEDGLADTPEGAALSCKPPFEAATFAALGADVWGALRAAPAPVSVLAARHPTSTLSAGAVRRLARMGAAVSIIEGASHLAPFENPARVADFIATAPRR